MAFLLLLKAFLCLLCSCFFVVPGVLFSLRSAFAEMICFQSPLLDTKAIFMLSCELSSGLEKEIFFKLFSAFFLSAVLALFMLILLFVLQKFFVFSQSFFFAFVPGIFLLCQIFFAPVFVYDIFLKAKTKNMARKSV